MLRILQAYILIITFVDIEYTMVFGASRKRTIGNMTAKIIGGVPAQIEDYPYMVQFYNSQKICAGSVVNSWTVLTAAHCFDTNQEIELMEIHAGGLYLQDFMSDTYSVDSIVIHQSYNKTRDFSYDIALIFLLRPFQFKVTVKKAVLVCDKSWMNETKTKFAVAGWGWTEYPEGKLSRTGLMKTYLKYIPNDVCSRMHGIDKIKDVVFCLYGDGKKDACRGDSGGGVFWKGMIVGIISHGYGCSGKGKPSFYTNLVYFRKWIKKQVLQFLNKICKTKHLLDAYTHQII